MQPSDITHFHTREYGKLKAGRQSPHLVYPTLLSDYYHPTDPCQLGGNFIWFKQVALNKGKTLATQIVFSLRIYPPFTFQPFNHIVHLYLC